MPKLPHWLVSTIGQVPSPSYSDARQAYAVHRRTLAPSGQRSVECFPGRPRSLPNIRVSSGGERCAERCGVDTLPTVLPVRTNTEGAGAMTPPHPRADVTEKPSRQDAADRIELANRLERHLAQAAKLASEYGVAPDAFAAAAWHA